MLKKGKLDKFESRSSDSIFLGYALHSCAYRVLILETNRIVETCEVKFDETMPCSISVFEHADDKEMCGSIFVEDEQEDGDWGDPKLPPPATLVDPASTTMTFGPNMTSSTTWGRWSQALLLLYLVEIQLLLRGGNFN